MRWPESKGGRRIRRAWALVCVLGWPGLAAAGTIPPNPYVPVEAVPFETCLGGEGPSPTLAVHVRLVEGTVSMRARVAILEGTITLGATTCALGRPVDGAAAPFQLSGARVELSLESESEWIWASLDGRGTLEARGVRIEGARLSASREDAGVIRVHRGRARIDGCDGAPATGSVLEGPAIAIASALRCGESRFVEGTVRVTNGRVAGTAEAPSAAEAQTNVDAAAVVREGMAEVQRCYERAARRAGFGAEERLVVQIRVSSRGQVRDAAVADASSRVLAECVESTVRAWRFARSPRGFEISVPIALRPRN